MNIRTVIEAVLTAAISGAATAMLDVQTNPDISIDKLMRHAMFGAVFGVALLLKQSPIKPKDPPQ